MKRAYLIFFFLSLTIGESLRALTRLEMATMGIAACATTWALIERHKKNERRKVGDELAKEVQEYKKEAKQIAADKELLSTWSEHLRNRLLAYDGDYQTKTWLKEAIMVAGSLNNFKRNLDQDIETFHTGLSSLEVKIPYWQKKRPEFIEQGKLLFEKCQSFVDLLISIKQYFDSQHPFIKLESSCNSVQERHKNVMGLVHDYGFGVQDVIRIVQENYPEKRFPFIAYAQELRRNKQEIEVGIQNCKNKEIGNNNHIIRHAEDLLRLLEEFYSVLVSSKEYKQQTLDKPLYKEQKAQKQREIAQKEARIASELREKEMKAQTDKCAAESRLCDLRTKELEQERKKNSLEFELRKAQVRTQELQLEQAKMQEKEVVKNAVDEKDKYWKKKYGALQSEMGAVSHRFKNDLVTAKNELAQLHDALDVPPYVPGEAQQGINKYINLLKRHLKNAREALC